MEHDDGQDSQWHSAVFSVIMVGNIHIHSMSLSARVSLLSLLLFLLPGTASAAPANVTGIRATAEPDGVRVSWDAVPGTVASYRIFYSHASILENGGLFDDFVTVDGDLTQHLLRQLPAVTELTVAVIAVDRTGEESPFFVEEATVTLPDTSTPRLEPSPVLAPDAAPVTLRLLMADSRSATGMVLSFSHVVQLHASGAVRITTATGGHLSVTAVHASGAQLIVTTASQQPGAIYAIRLDESITGIDGTTILPLVTDDMPTLIAGFVPPVIPPPTSAASSAPSATNTDVRSLILRAQPVGSLFTVEAQWHAVRDATHYEIRQTTDGGNTFGPVQSVPVPATGVRISRVTPGSFGLHVSALLSDGTRTLGSMQWIDLPGAALPLPDPLAGQLLPAPRPVPPTAVDHLSQSGPAFPALLALSGALGGLLVIRRRQRLRSA